MSRQSLIILDDFYTDPDYVRDDALKMKWYDKKGNHPGKRTDSIKDTSVFTAFEQSLNQKIDSKAYYQQDNYINGCFNLCTSLDKCWVHSDQYTTYACVIYLTPDAPIESGTGLYRHKKTGLTKPPTLKDGSTDKKAFELIESDGQDFTRWEQIDYVANVYNRAVIYRGDYFHAAVQYFGFGPEYCRLHQTFFFNTF